MVFGNVHRRNGSTTFVQGQRSAMFLWQCSSKVMAMFLRLDAFVVKGQMCRLVTIVRLLLRAGKERVNCPCEQ